MLPEGKDMWQYLNILISYPTTASGSSAEALKPCMDTLYKAKKKKTLLVCRFTDFFFIFYFNLEFGIIGNFMTKTKNLKKVTLHVSNFWVSQVIHLTFKW